ncbi:unnamed protein product [Aphanomyces euteiches]|uniref:Protein phosphatase n=1 Tax=Aphanomyces euteiches TaxID=100861 RepID=A0A6G0XEB8_9STRA|nr:hypothetical protein Ae201684_005768 [Aphanomyces euteiches]KAH9133354.1 hypothetical protein AeRB84_020489 [Aphanomyces euteiches]
MAGDRGSSRVQRGALFVRKMLGQHNNKPPQTPGTPSPLPSKSAPRLTITTPTTQTTTTTDSTTKIKGFLKRLRHRDRTPQHGSASFVFHGEDAMATATNYQIIADGVSNSNVVNSVSCSTSPSALLARALVHAVQQTLAQEYTPTHMTDFESLVVGAVQTAQRQCANLAREMGSTLLVAYVDAARKRLYTFSVGDSKCIVVRKGRIVYETLSVVKQFNVPSIVNHQILRPHMYVVQSIPLQRGDLVMSFSDGFGDNVFKDDLVKALAVARSSSNSLSAVCTQLMQLARTPPPAMDNVILPFSTAAATEYIARVDAGPCTDEEARKSQELAKRFQGRIKFVLARQVSVHEQDAKKHYSLAQLYNMANLQKKKPDDISLALLEFR